MRDLFTTSEQVGVVERDGAPWEVCATAEARYDGTANQVVVELASFLRPVDIRVKEEHQSAGWLPRSQTLRETVARVEATALTREIFHRWVAQVRQSIPILVTP